MPKNIWSHLYFHLRSGSSLQVGQPAQSFQSVLEVSGHREHHIEELLHPYFASVLEPLTMLQFSA